MVNSTVIAFTSLATALTLYFVYNWVKSKKKPPDVSKPAANKQRGHVKNEENSDTVETDSKLDNLDLEVEKKGAFVHSWVANNNNEIIRERNSFSDSTSLIVDTNIRTKELRISDSDWSSADVTDKSVGSRQQSDENLEIEASVKIEPLSTLDSCEEDSGFQKKSLSSQTDSILSKDGYDLTSEKDYFEEEEEESDLKLEDAFFAQTISTVSHEPSPSGDCEANVVVLNQDNDVPIVEELIVTNSVATSASQPVNSQTNVTVINAVEPQEDDIGNSSLLGMSWADIPPDSADSDVMEYIDETGMRRTIHFFDSKDLPDDFGLACADQNDTGRHWDDEMAPKEGEIVFQRCVPQQSCGLIFGRNGRNARELREKYKCRLQLTSTPYDPMSQTLHFVCPEVHLEEVERWYRHKMRICRALASESGSNVSNPQKLLKRLPIGQLVPVFVVGMESPTDLYVQMYNPEEYDEFQRFQTALDEHYITQDCPHLPNPVGNGAVCIATYLDGHYYRVKIIDQCPVLSNADVIVTVFYLDFGGQLQLPLSSLFKIKEEFMRFPFQAILVHWAHAEALTNDTGDIYTRFLQNRSIYTQAVMVDDRDVDHAVFFARTSDEPCQMVDILHETSIEGLYNFVPYSGCRLARVEDDNANTKRANIYWAPSLTQIDYKCLVTGPCRVTENLNKSTDVSKNNNCYRWTDEKPQRPYRRYNSYSKTKRPYSANNNRPPPNRGTFQPLPRQQVSGSRGSKSSSNKRRDSRS